jgi:hypothetical protein
VTKALPSPATIQDVAAKVECEGKSGRQCSGATSALLVQHTYRSPVVVGNVFECHEGGNGRGAAIIAYRRIASFLERTLGRGAVDCETQ